MAQTTPRILLLTPELAPYSRASVLSDRATAIARALGAAGARVTVITPFHRCVSDAQHPVEPFVDPRTRTLGGARTHIDDARGPEVVFMRFGRVTDRPGIYEDAGGRPYADNPELYTKLGAAAWRMLDEGGNQFDGALGLGPLGLQMEQGARDTANDGAPRWLSTALPDELPAAADIDAWDPAQDPHLPEAFSADAPEGKLRCKVALQRELGLLEDEGAPLAAVFVSTPQADAAAALCARGGQIVVLPADGSSVDAALVTLAAANPDRVRLQTGPDAALSHRLLGAADLVISPRPEDAARARRYAALCVHSGSEVDAALDEFYERDRWGALLSRHHEVPDSVEALAEALLFALDPTRPPKPKAEPTPAPPPEPEPVVEAAPEAEPIAEPEPAPEAEPDEAPYVDWGPTLPEAEGRDVVALLVQHPYSAYGYWELTGTANAEVVLYDAGSGRPVRQHPVTPGCNGGWFRVDADQAYVLRLEREGDILATSSRARSPRALPSDADTMAPPIATLPQVDLGGVTPQPTHGPPVVLHHSQPPGPQPHYASSKLEDRPQPALPEVANAPDTRGYPSQGSGPDGGGGD